MSKNILCSLKNDNDPTNFILLYFRFSYYLGLGPFQIVQQDKINRYRLKYWKPQMVICAFMNGLCTHRLFTEIRLGFLEPGRYEKDPILYFRMILSFFALVYKLLIMKRFWMNSQDFVDVLNCIKSETMLPTSKLKVQNAWVGKSIGALCILISCVDLIIGAYFVSPTWTWTPSWWFRQLISTTRFTFFYGPKPNPEHAPDLKDVKLADMILCGFTALGLFQRYIFGLFVDLSILSHVMTLWVTVYAFSVDLQTDLKEGSPPQINSNYLTDNHNQKKKPVKRWQVVYGHYKAIQQLSRTINKALGNLATWFLAEAVIFYAVNLDITLVTDDFYVKIYMFYYYCNTCSILFFSADICAQIGSLRTWLANDSNRKGVPWDEMQIVLHQLQANDIGIRGGNAFTITFSLVASYCSLVVTYFIISVQNSTHEHNIFQ